MYLKNLQINGFKSFAKKSEFEFATSVTAIVGPNGSGKSNVAEAFRFVLGEQSTKGLRAQKGADLIFSGSEKVSRSNRASVEIFLNNESRVFPLDFDEVKLERVVHRDGQNDYLINGSKVRLKDVQELLAAANIGPSGHHIISQGEADRILSANSRERREMIEDALGLKIFQYKRQEALKKLSKTEENIEKVESLRREVAPHLKYLHNQVKKMERAVALRAKLSDFYREYLYRESRYLEIQTAREKERVAPLKDKSRELLRAIEDSEEKLRTVTNNSYTEEIKTLEESLQAIRNNRQTVVKELGQIEGQVSLVKRQIEAKLREKNKENPPISFTKVSEMVDSVSSVIDKAGRSREVAHLERALQDTKNILQQFLSDQSRSNSVDVSEENELLKELELKGREVAAKLSVIEKKEKATTEQLQALHNQAHMEDKLGRQAERELFSLQSQYRECENKITEIDRNFSMLERERESFAEEVREAVVLVGREVRRYDELGKEREDLSDENIMAESREQQFVRRRELEKMKVRLEEMGGVDKEVEREYKDVSERDNFLRSEIADLEASVKGLEDLIKDLTKQLDQRFASGIEKISMEFNRFFTLMFGGGEARLLTVKVKQKKTDEDPEGDEDDEEGVDILAKLPNKRIAGLDMLSGGERALTSIALIFAMSQVNPPLFIILDETDAALDEANSRRYGDMIEALAKKSQLILITHNRETMSRAGILYGITMAGDGVSKLLSVKLEDAVAIAK